MCRCRAGCRISRRSPSTDRRCRLASRAPLAVLPPARGSGHGPAVRRSERSPSDRRTARRLPVSSPCRRIPAPSVSRTGRRLPRDHADQAAAPAWSGRPARSLADGALRHANGPGRWRPGPLKNEISSCPTEAWPGGAPTVGLPGSSTAGVSGERPCGHGDCLRPAACAPCAPHSARPGLPSCEPPRPPIRLPAPVGRPPA